MTKEATVILIAPIWPPQSWFATALKMLVQQPCLLPANSLILPQYPKLKHALDKMGLATMKLSGNRCKQLTYHQGSSRSCQLMAWASYQICKIAGCACAGNAGNVFPRRRFQSKPLVSDPGMHHVTCVTHVPWCMPGSLTCGDGENVPGIPGACAPAILCIW